MSHIDLNSLPLSELIRIKKEIPKAIEKLKKSEIITLRKKMEALAAESGFNLDEVILGNKKNIKHTVSPKYMNPQNPTQTWSGRGRKPKWVELHISKGRKLEKLLIKK